MNFCSICGASVSLQRLDGDHRKRFVCDGCNTTHYQSPTIVVAVYVCVGEEILWIKRGVPPAENLWAIPGGYMESDETPEEAASRELLEETGIAISPKQMMLVSISSITHISQTHLVYRCHLDACPATVATDEAPQCDWFTEDDLPWPELAFATIEPQIRQMYRWLRNGNYGIRVGVVDKAGSHYHNYPLAL